MIIPKSQRRNIVRGVSFGIIMLVIAVIIFNRSFIYDWWRGITYAPSEEMSRIRSSLNLTGEGEFIFNSVQPSLIGGAEFNANCRSDTDTEIAVLGCFTGDSVFVYDVQSDELDGIKELTTAHELLHAVWARLDSGEKTKINSSLRKVLESNSSYLDDEMKNYNENQRQEELYVRAGTEVKDLPSDLEEHYARYFKDQDAVVHFYDKYIGVFRELEASREQTRVQMEEIDNIIHQKNDEYGVGVEQLNEEINKFNKCAETVGCFSSQWAFDVERAALVREQESLKALYNEIDGLISQYNQLVEKYNNDVTMINKLNSQINSNSKIEDINE
ncbi:hypothetical protein IKE98_00050 [Candidatus Saccharibacteria bacterium]|nr:hypothetical protein [Candidatus Saccharibacteria bacterium]